MRDRALAITADELKVPVDRGEAVLGVVSDWAMENGAVATVVCFVTGDASLYLSTDGGVIGGIAHERVRRVADHVIRTASGLAQHFAGTAEHPLPPAGMMRFAALTTVRAYAAVAPCSELAAQTHALAPLGNAVQTLIGALRASGDRGDSM